MRYTISLNFTWFVNSAAHIWGTKPYDKSISPTENIAVAIAAVAEGWHNYHHSFPWDYKAAELGNYRLSLSTAFIDFCAWLGLAYDLKKASPDLILKRIVRTGDGGHTVIHDYSNDVWEWEDKGMTEEEKKMVELVTPKIGNQ